MGIKVLLVEDNDLIRRALKIVINSQNDMSVVGEAVNGQAAVEQAKVLNPNLVIMDFYLAQLRGDEATKQLLAVSQGIRVLGYSAHPTEAGPAMLAAGAIEVVEKSVAPDALLDAIRRVTNAE